MTENTAVLAPILMARTATAVTVNPRARFSSRQACRMSRPTSSSSCFISSVSGTPAFDYDHSVLHDPADAVDDIADVFQWFPLDGDEIGREARSDAPQRVLLGEQFRCRRGGGGEGLGRRHARLDHPFELARVLAEHGIDGVRSHPEF